MIQSRAMLAQLSISQWTARKQDKTVTAEVERAHAAHDAGKFNKLLVDKTLLEPISKLSAKVREYHYFTTLAWSDSGARLLPSALFMDYTVRMRGFKADFQRAVNDMLAKYPAEVQAARARLGSMYKPDDYPQAAELRQRFSVDVEFLPVPDGADFRLDLSEEAQTELRQSVTQSVANRQAAAVQSTYQRVRDVVSKIADRLSVDDAVFKDSLIGNARDLCVVLKALNITDDAGINDVHDQIYGQLLKRPDLLRTDLTLRKQVAQKAAEILQNLPT
jgi:hypothetical protein